MQQVRQLCLQLLLNTVKRKIAYTEFTDLLGYRNIKLPVERLMYCNHESLKSQQTR